MKWYMFTSDTTTGEGCCIGATTTVAQRGLPNHLIKTLGRWSSEAYLLYVCTLGNTTLSVIARLSRQIWYPSLLFVGWRALFRALISISHEPLFL